MNEVLKAIHDRRSSRAYKQDKLTKEQIDTLTDAAFATPSASNRQPWHVTVVTDGAVIEAMVEGYNEWHRENGTLTPEIEARHNFYHAPAVFVVSSQTEFFRYAANDIGAMAQTLCLAAHSMGLGTCIVWNVLPAFQSKKRDELIKALGIPEGYEPYTTVAVGYHDGEMPEAKPRDKTKINYV